MPFTFSHPAIIIPLSKTKLRLSFTGLVAGSMAPDFEFFFKMKLAENVGHHFWGIFIFDLPIALILCFIYHNILRNVFIKHLPNYFKNRLSLFMNFNWNSYTTANKLILIISLIIGIVSHLLWDGFTHYDGVFVLMMPLFAKSISIYNFNIQIFNALQIIGSVWGLWVVYRYIKALPVKYSSITKPVKTYIYWISITMLSACILAFRIFLLPDFNTAINLLFAAIGSVIYAWIAVSIIIIKFDLIKWQEE